jgi:hypothetical protein
MKQLKKWREAAGETVWQGPHGLYEVPQSLWSKYPHPAPGPRLQKRVKAANKERNAALRNWASRMDWHVVDCIFGKTATTANIPQIE